MNPIWTRMKDVIVQLVGRATSGPGFLVNAIRTATYSVAAGLAELMRMKIAKDLSQLKDDGLRRSKAKTDAEEAKARELMAKAVEAENRATIIKRNDRISRAEERQKLAEAAKTNAEAHATLLKAEADQAQAKADAMIKLLEAVAKLNEKGGTVAVDPKNLSKLLGIKNLEELAESKGSAPPKE